MELDALIEGWEHRDQCLPILIIRNIIAFPNNSIDIVITSDSAKQLVNKIKSLHYNQIAIFTQMNYNVDKPSKVDLFPVGVRATVIDYIENGPDGTLSLEVLTTEKCAIDKVVETDPYLLAWVKEVDSFDIPDNTNTALEHELISKHNALLSRTDDLDVNLKMIKFTEDQIQHYQLHTLAQYLPGTLDDKSELILCNDYRAFVGMLIKQIDVQLKFLVMRDEIQSSTQTELNDEQREYFLRREKELINRELGQEDGSPDKKKLKEKAATLNWNEDSQKFFDKELERLDQLNPHSPEYNTQLTYLQQIVDLPWGNYTEDDLDLKRAMRILNRDHYGMEKVKERILEYIAVLKLRGDLKSPILCLYGPPGVGKTSLGKSIADSLKRKYVRVSLGGLHDEAEIRGHRRTYIGAMPGRIIKSLEKAGTSNPVFILDEIDKITRQTNHGDPSSALLEVLDPEQNGAFHDNYIDMDYDLSKVMFIATANDLSTIPAPLRDRMEIIELTGYTTEEKIEIAKRHLVPREKEKTGLNNLANTEIGEAKITFPKATLEKIIERYTRESGVRQLEKQINKVLRKIAFYITRDGELNYEKISPDHIEELLGTPPFYRDIYQGNDYAGVVTGLAWTSVGGEILFIETSLSKSKNAKLTLTGNLGDVMKESAIIALEYVKAHAGQLNIDPSIFENWSVHIHVPEGATPKDGPSAGITIATSIASALTQRKVRKNVAMTGEITLRGKVLPVGGIKEKLLAAKRAGITDIMLCSANEKDVKDIPEKYLKGVTFHYVENVKDVWDFALTDIMVDNPLVFND